MATIIISLIIIAALVFAAKHVKENKSSCNCSGCGSHCSHYKE